MRSQPVKKRQRQSKQANRQCSQHYALTTPRRRWRAASARTHVWRGCRQDRTLACSHARHTQRITHTRLLMHDAQKRTVQDPRDTHPIACMRVSSGLREAVSSLQHSSWHTMLRVSSTQLPLAHADLRTCVCTSRMHWLSLPTIDSSQHHQSNSSVQTISAEATSCLPTNTLQYAVKAPALSLRPLTHTTAVHAPGTRPCCMLISKAASSALGTLDSNGHMGVALTCVVPSAGRHEHASSTCGSAISRLVRQQQQQQHTMWHAAASMPWRQQAPQLTSGRRASAASCFHDAATAQDCQ